jgi:hypothetical protein
MSQQVSKELHERLSENVIYSNNISNKSFTPLSYPSLAYAKQRY